MTALEMILEGANFWSFDVFGLTVPNLALFAFLFVLGVSIAATVVKLLRNKPEKIDAASNERPDEFNNILEFAPFPVWSVIDGEISYTNSKYHDVAGLDANPAGIFAYSETNNSSRNMVTIEGQQRWYTTTEIVAGEEIYTFALPADALVSAEGSLKRLMETLSTTFAHLPVGLMIFDADKTLTQFNPAVTELLDLDATWLTMRPSMSAFLERIRENRHLPEKKNFLEWRRLLTEMQATKPNNNYADQWYLPNGTALRVTGQAHSQGATTFLFEDITKQIDLERRHHAEMALNQAVLDRLNDAIVIINPAGGLAFANASFDRLFGLDSTENLATPDINSLMLKWPDAKDFWSKLHGYVSQSQDRATWHATLEIADTISAEISPMPDGSTLVTFTDVTNNFESQQISTLFHTADSMFSKNSESTIMQDPLNLAGLTNFLNQRKITFDLQEYGDADFVSSDQTNARRILWYLVLAASNICRNGGRISLTSKACDHGIKVSCIVDDEDILKGQNNHLSVSLLRQLVSQSGGEADWEFDHKNYPLSVSCILPIVEETTVTQFLAGGA